MDWSVAFSAVLGAIVGGLVSIGTTAFAYRRERSDRIRDEKRAVFANYLGLVSGFARSVTELRLGGDVDAIKDHLVKMQFAEAQLALMSPEIAKLNDELEILDPDAEYQELKRIADLHRERLLGVMLHELETT